MEETLKPSEQMLSALAAELGLLELMPIPEAAASSENLQTAKKTAAPGEKRTE